MNDVKALVCRDICKSYGEGGSVLSILRGIDLEVGRGETVAVTGPSGSGKSTLLNILGILEPPDSGIVLIGGTDAWLSSERRRAVLRNRKLGFVFQFHHLMEEFTILENVSIPLLIAGRPKAEAREAAASILGEVGMEARADHFPSSVSGGERQRAAIARALVTRPDVVLADEPSGNLDPMNGERLRDLMRQLASDHGQAFVVATHSATLAAGSDRSYRLVSGRLVEEDPVCRA